MTGIHERVQGLIREILEGRILEAFEEYYAEDVVMSENRVDERIGKEANRASETFFVENFTLHSVTFGAVLVDGDRAAVESTWDFTFPDGRRVLQHQVSVQVWRDGQIVREDFYHG